MNKKGDKIISVYWFAILILVAGGIFAMVYTFYHYPYDVREIEANIMINKVADCISTGGEINAHVFEDDFSVLEICDLTFNVEDEYGWKEIPQYYFNIEFYQNNTLISDIEEGNKNLISSCGVEEDVEKEKLAKCVEREFYSLNEGDLYLIKILSIVRKTEKNVR